MADVLIKIVTVLSPLLIFYAQINHCFTKMFVSHIFSYFLALKTLDTSIAIHNTSVWSTSLDIGVKRP